MEKYEDTARSLEKNWEIFTPTLKDLRRFWITQFLPNIPLSRRCWTILPGKIVRGAATNSVSCLKVAECAGVIRKSRLIFATSVTSFPVRKQILIPACIKDG
jgi:hypothetical protein